MANGYPMMNYGRPYPKTPEQLQNEMQTTIDQYQNMFQSYQMAPQTQHPPARRGGEYFEVADAHEMEEAPTRLDGTAALFFDFKNRVFWSKKYVNGGHSIQTYRFEPILSSSLTAEEDVDYTKELEEKPKENNNDSMEEIKELLLKLVERDEQRGSKRNTKPSGRDSESAGTSGEGT